MASDALFIHFYFSNWLSSFYQYIYKMNNRILRPSNNGKRTLQIVRNNKPGVARGSTILADQVKENHFRLFDSSREVAANIMLSQKESQLPPQQKKISFSESQNSLAYDRDASGPALQKGLLKKGRSSSAFKVSSSARLGGLEELVGGYVEMLRGRGLLHLQHGNFIVESNKLARILAFIINAYNSSQNILSFHHKLVRAEETFTDFMRKCEYGKGLPSERLKFKKLLALSSKVYEQAVFNTSHEHLRTQSSRLQSECILLQEEARALRARRDEVQAEVAKRHNEFTIVKFQIEKLQQDFDQYIKREEYLKGIINAREEVLADLDQRRYGIVRVYEEPQMAAHRQCFEESRRLEESLLLFADFLKCHPLGDRGYEQSKRTVCNERLLEKELREVKRMMGGHPETEKEGLLAAFLDKYHQEYRDIIRELQAVISEKTALIHRFTESIEDWRGKYLSKHGILAALKDTFLLQEIEFEQLRSRARQGQGQGQGQGEAMRIIENVIKLFKVCHPLL